MRPTAPKNLAKSLRESFTAAELLAAIDRTLLSFVLLAKLEPESLEEQASHYEILFDLQQLLKEEIAQQWK